MLKNTVSLELLYRRYPEGRSNIPKNTLNCKNLEKLGENLKELSKILKNLVKILKKLGKILKNLVKS